MNLQLDNYQVILNNLKEKIRQKRVQAFNSINTSLLSIYHEIGKTILEQQKIEGWGSKIIDRLASDLKLEFPDIKGFSIRNLKYMRTFAETYPNLEFGQQPVAQIQDNNNQLLTIVQPLVARLPWTHHIIILDKVKTTEERLFYIKKTIENGWSKNILSLQIESKLFERQGKAITNFEITLPQYQSDLVKETFKNPYIFDFLSLNEEVQERELEKALIEHLKKFMLELGRGFAYVGNQVNLYVEDDDFFFDLLFYNYRLKCFVIFELKVGAFKPEYAGKLNFYVNTLDAKLKGADDQPSIGILLCKTPNETVIKYSLQGIQTPIGVTDYKLTHELPKQFEGELPSAKELEAEINKETKKLQKPIESKIDTIKELLNKFKSEEIKEIRNEQNIADIFYKVLLPLKNSVNEILIKEIPGWFYEIQYIIWTGSSGYLTDEQAINNFKQYKTFFDFKIELNAKGFKRAGVKAFDLRKEIKLLLEDYKYTIKFDIPHTDSFNVDYLYHQLPKLSEIDKIAERFCEAFMDEIKSKLELNC